MIIDRQTILSRIENEFCSYYKAFSKFHKSGIIWDECINSINNPKLMNHIIFCNDILQLPPAYIFLKANKILTNKLSNFEKQSIGAFWGFVFKFVLDYEEQKEVEATVHNLFNASYFFNQKHEIEVV